MFNAMHGLYCTKKKIDKQEDIDYIFKNKIITRFL